MSSCHEARLAREKLFTLEALEPRRLLSGGDIGEPIAIDSDGTAIAGAFDGSNPRNQLPRFRNSYVFFIATRAKYG
jgi:hypothetical protein